MSDNSGIPGTTAELFAEPQVAERSPIVIAIDHHLGGDPTNKQFPKDIAQLVAKQEVDISIPPQIQPWINLLDQRKERFSNYVKDCLTKSNLGTLLLQETAGIDAINFEMSQIYKNGLNAAMNQYNLGKASIAEAAENTRELRTLANEYILITNIVFLQRELTKVRQDVVKTKEVLQIVFPGINLTKGIPNIDGTSIRPNAFQKTRDGVSVSDRVNVIVPVTQQDKSIEFGMAVDAVNNAIVTTRAGKTNKAISISDLDAIDTTLLNEETATKLNNAIGVIRKFAEGKVEETRKLVQTLVSEIDILFEQSRGNSVASRVSGVEFRGIKHIAEVKIEGDGVFNTALRKYVVCSQLLVPANALTQALTKVYSIDRKEDKNEGFFDAKELSSLERGTISLVKVIEQNSVALLPLVEEVQDEELLIQMTDEMALEVKKLAQEKNVTQLEKVIQVYLHKIEDTKKRAKVLSMLDATQKIQDIRLGIRAAERFIASGFFRRTQKWLKDNESTFKSGRDDVLSVIHWLNEGKQESLQVLNLNPEM